MEAYHFINHSDGQRAGRTYSVWMQTDLFGEWVVVRVHGSRSRAGRMIVTPVEGQEAGDRLARRICGVKVKHGYEENTIHADMTYLYTE